MKRQIWLRALSIVVSTLCIVTLSSPNVWAAQQSGDVWTELGGSFRGATASDTESTVAGNTYVLPTSGAEVVIVDGLEPEDSDFEDQIILNTPQGMGAIAVVPKVGTPESVMQTYADAFGDSLDGSSEIYSESDRQFASGLYSFNLLSVPMVMYITVDAGAFPDYLTIQVVIAESDISGAIESFREKVAINGVPMFDAIDEQDVQDHVNEYLNG